MCCADRSAPKPDSRAETRWANCCRFARFKIPATFFPGRPIPDEARPPSLYRKQPGNAQAGTGSASPGGHRLHRVSFRRSWLLLALAAVAPGAQARGLRLLKENLSAEQREQHESTDILMWWAGKRLPDECPAAGREGQAHKPVAASMPEVELVVGDVMPAQKLALELFRARPCTKSPTSYTSRGARITCANDCGRSLYVYGPAHYVREPQLRAP